MFTSSSKVNGKKTVNNRGIIAPIVLVAFFVYAVLPLNIKIAQASECVDWDGDGWGWDGEKGCKMDAKLTPPTTINNKTEEVDDYDQFDNGIPRAIPVDSQQLSAGSSQDDPEGDKCKPTADSATNGGWGWDGEKGCKLGSELPPFEKGGIEGGF